MHACMLGHVSLVDAHWTKSSHVNLPGQLEPAALVVGNVWIPTEVTLKELAHVRLNHALLTTARMDLYSYATLATVRRVLLACYA